MHRNPTKNAVAILAYASLLGMASARANAMTTVLGSRCDLKAVGATDGAPFITYFQVLKAAAAAGDETAFAPLFRYPARVNATQGPRLVQTPAHLVQGFVRIITPTIVEVIRSQKIEDLFCNDSGVMLGNGEVWVGLDRLQPGDAYGIKVINLP